MHLQDLGVQGKTIQHDNDNYDEDDNEDYFHANEEEEFIRVEDSQQSCQILPIDNIKQAPQS